MINPLGTICLLLLLITSNTWAGENEILNACKTSISNKYQKWRKATVTNEVSEWARSQGKSPTEIYGDFNDDGYGDVALLIQVGSSPKNDYPERLDSLYIAICLVDKKTARLYLINKLYCGDLISLSPKGKKYYNFDTEKTGRYKHDGVAAICFDKAGATYMWNGKTFTRIVDSD